MHPQVLFVDFSVDNSVRMAHAEPGRRPPASAVYHCASLPELDAALAEYLGKAGNPTLLGAAFSICGWERDGTFEMPNHSYRIDRAWIKERLDITRLNLVNDCVAAALAIDQLDASERTVICHGADEPNQMKALIALGRGLGTTCIVSDDLGNPLALPCAGGHGDLPATSDREYAVVGHLAARFGHVSRVRAVSNTGLANVFSSLQALDGVAVEGLEPAEVVDRARAGDGRAREAIDMVVGWLGATASDMALSVGARSGIYLAGTFFDVLGDLFDRSLFARRFHEKGRLTSYLEDIPVFAVKTHEVEMLGLSTLFAR